MRWTRSPWSELPRRQGSASNCRGRLKLWKANDTNLRFWGALPSDLNSRDQIHRQRVFCRRQLPSAKECGFKVGSQGVENEQRG